MSNSSLPTVSPHNDYPVNFYFQVGYNNENIAFREVSGISQEMAIEEVACGGENRFKYRLPVIASTKNLVLKSAVLPQSSTFNTWCLNTLSGGFSQSITTCNLLVDLLNPAGQVCLAWTFNAAYPVKYSVSDLNSQDGSIIIQSVELAYTFFQVTTNSIVYPTPSSNNS
ncbi:MULTISPECIES: phage tail protein [unclassified Mucilaginibacter]|uniref:phage tail protein n=1 Tax=unclassified Mucilaginibacter TaxID=2617802 RepID=UPI00138D6C2F|nr:MULTISPECIES: phage tail protein [unclassified Mucilaginibacter]MBB5395245.1 phage tail-like protein [Mucilaginibacter sp. AK015]QHS56446.1 phage tail protein [Mucilaginibacter sp. 14171R-50]